MAISTQINMKRFLGIRQQLSSVILILIALGLNQADGHSVWVEEYSEDTSRLVIRFGEFDDSYEESPGYLDALDAFKIYSDTGEDGGEPVKVAVSSLKDGYVLNEPTEYGVLVQTGFPVMARSGGPAVRPNFYARWIADPSKEHKPKMNLDIVPVGVHGEFRVYFQGKPLPGVVVNIYSPEANDVELTSDDQGIIRYKSDEKGLFMAKVGRFREERAGFERGVAYVKESHNCSVTWVQK